MLRIQVKEGENIDRALKRYKRKCKDVKLVQEIRSRKEYIKKSVKMREQLKKAQHKAKYLREHSDEI
ncbi:30S ribosomal protein S21 [Aquimarina sp. 2201CG5-10]|uniref:30S ribosomal protein S21 n=1 Tax=Aquimarina callyspongiae TaxID=3098150 RepID=UPI002AB3318D|nr:30S ribosomal protein S21 [Aquimarina sp. 2201CG5-10]MDY8134270.1 30S ribosomal protein S21 [Aquimarina sp. 2201CG5-10]